MNLDSYTLWVIAAVAAVIASGLLGSRKLTANKRQRTAPSHEGAKLHERHADMQNASPAEIRQRRQQTLLQLLELEKITVDDIMIPRSEVTGIDLDDKLPQIIEQLRTTTNTRLPVFRGELNQVEGIVHMRRLASLLTQGKLTHESLLECCQPPYFVPEGTPLATQLINFQKEKRRLGLVVDEYGDVQGIVTFEDLLDEIVGDFSDQENAENPEIHPQADGTQIIDGAANIREINKALGWRLPSDGPKTLNGLITEALETIPDSPVCLRIGPYRLEILESSESRVISVRLWQAQFRRRAQ